MRLDFFQKEKLIKGIVILIVAVSAITVMRKLSIVNCYDYVDNLCYECNDISDLADYIEYSMLSSDIKKCIKKDELNFSSDFSIYHIAEKLSNVENRKKINTYTCSTNSFPHTPLHQQVIINGTQYTVYYTIVFSPRMLSSKPEIVEWDAYVKDINNNVCISSNNE